VFGARFAAELVTAEMHIVRLGIVRPEAKSMVVLAVFRIVHSHDAYGPLVELACPALQRHCHIAGSLPATISSGTRPAASMVTWKR
jgi:hypothetical protein